MEGDPLTGWATVGLGVVALATLVYTAHTAKRDRRDADRRIKEQQDFDERRARRDRADADARLEAERKAADERLESERVHMEKVRERERQQDSATRLLRYIARLLPLMGRVPHVFIRSGSTLASGVRGDAADVGCEQVVQEFQLGGLADLPGLHDSQASEQCRTLVHLVLTAAHGKHHHGPDTSDAARKQLAKLATLDLLRYATFVRLSLEHSIEQGESLNPGDGGAGISFPMFARRPGDGSAWAPRLVPQGWQAAVSRDNPADPSTGKRCSGPDPGSRGYC
ncbi:hypothetical protein ATK30_4953 [Amycolatopsis echigonensis]|uniref:Uncharacterized protein n=1 Tax=Amycolatopsis echigonensis TaxID=2576905 RepID=A0A2N3WJN5_9PSEU|nr:hypothetical protein [Amycolatopsis niigatensis]PKV94084.1 hypothetical protein ATK30_4953 [Amycolatopsis niigatensis]